MLMAVGSIGDVLRGPAAPGQPYERFKCIIASFDISNSRHFLTEIIKNYIFKCFCIYSWS